MTKAVSVSLRPATLDDLEFLSASHRSGHAAIEAERGGELDILLRGRPEPIEDSFRTTMDDADTRVLVGEVDGLAVGYLVLANVDLRSGNQIARVTDMWVHPNARGVGVGGALMTKAMAIAGEQGCTGIDARALPGDRPTKNFFESFGLVARTIEVHKSL